MDEKEQVKQNPAGSAALVALAAATWPVLGLPLQREVQEVFASTHAVLATSTRLPHIFFWRLKERNQGDTSSTQQLPPTGCERSNPTSSTRGQHDGAGLGPGAGHRSASTRKAVPLPPRLPRLQKGFQVHNGSEPVHALLFIVERAAHELDERRQELVRRVQDI